jgi:hypothetical protein
MRSICILLLGDDKVRDHGQLLVLRNFLYSHKLYSYKRGQGRMFLLVFALVSYLEFVDVLFLFSPAT